MQDQSEKPVSDTETYDMREYQRQQAMTMYATAPETPKYDYKETVDHPKHYNSHPSGIECIDVIEQSHVRNR